MEGGVGIVSVGSERGPERERKDGTRERKSDGAAGQVGRAFVFLAGLGLAFAPCK